LQRNKHQFILLLTIILLPAVTPLRAKDAGKEQTGQSLKNILKIDSFHQSLLNAVPVAVFFKDRNGYYLGCNDVFSDIMGVSSEEISGKTVHELWPDELAEHYHQADLDLMENPEHQIYEFKVKDRDGIFRPVIFGKQVFYDTDDRVAGLVGAFVDISAQKTLQAALEVRTLWFLAGAALFITVLLFLLIRLAASLKSQKTQAEELESFFSVNLDLLCIADLEGNFIKTNEAWSQILGYSTEELNRKSFLDFVHPEDMQATLNAMDNLGKGNEVINFTNRYRSKKGSYHHIEWRSHPKGNLIYAAARDVTERIQAEEKQLKLIEQLHQSQKMDAVGQLAGGIAHDFNNLLAGIIGFAELLLVKEKTSENQQKYISNIITSANRAGNLTKKLLTFSHRGIKASSAIDCTKIISDTIEILKRTIDKSIDISFADKSEAASIIGDDSILQNVFLNISINAAHAMPHGGKLIFTAKNIYLDRDYCSFSPFDILPGEFLEISIKDTGTGMPREIMSRIFDPFFTTKEPGKGTGLGLSMVYAAISEHSGAINVYSEPGTGTEFHIYLPLSKETQSAKVSSASLTQGSGTILLIDDEELIRISAAALLKSMGYTVMQAENGKHGLEVFEKHHKGIDLIILDMIMPVMGGRDSFRKFREINPHIPILISSGFAREEDMTLLKEQGISGFLQKPFRSAELSEAVSKILSKKTARENLQ